MKYTLLVFLAFIITCETKKDDQDIPVIYTQSTLLDSFMLGMEKVKLMEYRDTIEYSTLVAGQTEENIYFKFKLDEPLSELQLMDIINDSIPEIVIYECVACDPRRIRIFTFDSVEQQFVRVKGIEDLIGDVYHHGGTDMVYTIACYNRGGCESKLLQFKTDSAYIAASMWMPYEHDTAVIDEKGISASAKYGINKSDRDMFIDSLIQKIWIRRKASKQ
jgi:hypothetical protein